MLDMETHVGTKGRLGRSMTLDEVTALLGWSEADKAAHLQSRAAAPDPDPAVIAEARARLAARADAR
jgi:hypothetical protein